MDVFFIETTKKYRYRRYLLPVSVFIFTGSYNLIPVVRPVKPQLRASDVGLIIISNSNYTGTNVKSLGSLFWRLFLNLMIIFKQKFCYNCFFMSTLFSIKMNICDENLQISAHILTHVSINFQFIAKKTNSRLKASNFLSRF